MTMLALLQSSTYGSEGSGFGIGSAIFMLVVLAFAILVIAGVWKVFDKAGQPGWGALIPIYNIILLLKIAKRPLWWVILMILPLISIIIAIIVCIDIARYFGKGSGFGIGLALLGPIFFPVLGFGDAQYQG